MSVYLLADKPVRILKSLGYNVFLGGDLSFESTNFGVSCAMTYGCFMCNKRFVRGEGAQDAIDFKVYESRSNPAVENEIKRQKFVRPKESLVGVDREFVVPPTLHAKILIGNVLFDRLLGKNFCLKINF